MAGSPEPVETPKLGWKATVAGLVFALTVLVGFGAATAASYDGEDHHKDEYGEHDESHDDEKAHDDDHSDEHGDDDH